MAGWIRIRQHVWCDEQGTPVLRHTKYVLPNGDVSFPWEHRIDFGNGIARWFKGNGTDQGITPPLLYPMPVFVGADRDAHVYVVEGEADVEAGQEHGLLAVTAGMAGAFKYEHARLFKGWGGRITIVRDHDLPGAWGAAKAYEALRSIGIPASRLRVARGRVAVVKSDLRDHLEAGYSAEDLVSEPIALIRKLAACATAESFSRAGYGDWVVVRPDEAAQLTNWKPVAQ